MSNWFKRLFSASPASRDAPLDVAVETHEEKTLGEARLGATGGGGPAAFNTGGVEAGEAVEGELSEYEHPSE